MPAGIENISDAIPPIIAFKITKVISLWSQPSARKTSIYSPSASPSIPVILNKKVPEKGTNKSKITISSAIISKPTTIASIRTGPNITVEQNNNDAIILKINLLIDIIFTYNNVSPPIGEIISQRHNKNNSKSENILQEKNKKW